MSKLIGENILMRIFIGEHDRYEHQSLYEALVELFRKEGFAGATVLRGLCGFGANRVSYPALARSLRRSAVNCRGRRYRGEDQRDHAAHRCDDGRRDDYPGEGDGYPLHPGPGSLIHTNDAFFLIAGGAFSCRFRMFND